MAFLTADVVDNPGGKMPFKVVFQQGQSILSEWEVESKAAGEQQILEIINEALEDDEGEDADK